MKKHLITILICILILIPITSGTSIDFSNKSADKNTQSLDEAHLHYYNPNETSNVIWTPPEPPFYVKTAIRLNYDKIKPYLDWNLTRVRIKISSEFGQTEFHARLIIYEMGSTITPGPILYEDNNLYFDSSGYFDIELSDSIPLEEHIELWIALEWEMTDEAPPPVFLDDGPAVYGKGDWIKWGDDDWLRLTDVGMSYNWYIGAIIEGVIVMRLPDLVITDIRISRLGPNLLPDVVSVFKNIGTSSTSDIPVRTTVRRLFLGIIPIKEDYNIYHQSHPGYVIEPGEETFIIALTNEEIHSSFGFSRLYCTVNPNGLIEELDYTNNQYNATIFHIGGGFPLFLNEWINP